MPEKDTTSKANARCYFLNFNNNEHRIQAFSVSATYKGSSSDVFEILVQGLANKRPLLDISILEDITTYLMEKDDRFMNFLSDSMTCLCVVRTTGM